MFFSSKTVSDALILLLGFVNKEAIANDSAFPPTDMVQRTRVKKDLDDSGNTSSAYKFYIPGELSD